MNDLRNAGGALYTDIGTLSTERYAAGMRDMDRAIRATTLRLWELMAIGSEWRAEAFCNASWLGKQMILMQYGWDQIRGR